MTTNTENNMEAANVGTNATANQPVAKLRIGLLTASIWQRVLPEGTFHSASFERELPRQGRPLADIAQLQYRGAAGTLQIG